KEKLNARSHHREPRRAYHPLTGILICGKCGEGMVCQRRTLNGVEYRYYICKTYHKYGRSHCDQKNINAAQIEPAVLEDAIDAIKKFTYNKSKVVAQKSIDVQKLEKELARLNREKERLKKDQIDT